MFMQSCINTKPPIEVVIGHTSFTGRKSGHIKIGDNTSTEFSNIPKHIVEELENIIILAYNTGYGEASTYFLDKYNKN